jgi:hypothetical protein
MRSIFASTGRVLAATAAIVVTVWAALQAMNEYQQTDAVKTLRAFRGTIQNGESRAAVLDRAHRESGFRVTDTGDTVLISVYTCHCSVRFLNSTVAALGEPICNG